ncbi:MAG TPA: DUF1501 domain-containing protein [Planctomycetaceae bacterium]|nr:DUF1501 domain-containing protein [Planctomycetaceae bacterium]
MPHSSSIPRRELFGRTSLGLGSIALSAMLQDESIAGQMAERTAKAKSVIWLFMIGGASHMETFDPKPALNRFAGKTIEETRHANVLESPYLENERVVAFDPNNGFIRNEIYPLQTGYRPRGESGLLVSDWLPELGECADDLAVVRSMWTEDSNHGAQLQFHTGRHRVDGFFPTVGAWANYGLGTLNDELPKFVVLGTPVADCCGGRECHRANYLGPQYDGIPLDLDSEVPLPYALPPKGVFRQEQAGQFGLLRQLSKIAQTEYPDDAQLDARVKSYELAYRMQAAVPEAVDLATETAHAHRLYGLDQPQTKQFGRYMLTARRLVERGVRFVQVYHGSNGGAGQWDSHKGLKAGHSKLCRQIDRPVAGLLKDLKQRGMLDETLVVWATEFGRTPGSQHGNGRDHHPYGFSIWMAGGGIKGGIAHGSTDELGFHAVEDRHYVTDVHATVLHQLGLDPHALAIPGRKRLEKEFGSPIEQIIA